MGLLLLVEVIIITKKVPDSLSTPAMPHTLYTICNICVWDLGLNGGFYQFLFSMQMKAKPFSPVQGELLGLAIS